MVMSLPVRLSALWRPERNSDTIGARQEATSLKARRSKTQPLANFC